MIYGDELGMRESGYQRLVKERGGKERQSTKSKR